MQNILGHRLPKFTKEEVKMVKGSMDFVGINQYTAYYMYDAHQGKPKVLGYQQDWNASFACKILSSPPSFKKITFLVVSQKNDLCACSLKSFYEWKKLMLPFSVVKLCSPKKRSANWSTGNSTRIQCFKLKLETLLIP